MEYEKQLSILKSHTAGVKNLALMRATLILRDDERSYHGVVKSTLWGAAKVVVCPICGSGDHLASRSLWNPYAPMHCWATDKMFLCEEPDIVGTIETEEKTFMELLNKFYAIVPEHLSAAEAFRWRHEKGAPDEMVRRRCDQPEEYDALMDEQAAADRKRGTFASEVFVVSKERTSIWIDWRKYSAGALVSQRSFAQALLMSIRRWLKAFSKKGR